MKTVNLNIGNQQVTSDELDTLAKEFCGTRLTLDDNGVPSQNATINSARFTATINGCYSDSKSAIEDKFNATITNTGNTYRRILDPAVKEVLVANMSAGAIENNRIKASSFEELTDIKTWFRSNADIVSFDELKLSNIERLNVNCFLECINLCSIDVSNLKYITQNSFGNCNKLKTLYFKNLLYANASGNTSTTNSSYWYDPFQSVTSRLHIFAPKCKIMQTCANGLIDLGHDIDWFDSYRSDRNQTLIIRNSNNVLSADMSGTVLAFVSYGLLSNYKESDFWNKSNIQVYSIGSTEWQATMQSLATEEGVTLDSIHTKFPNYSTVGWDYEYIDYLIYGVEPPSEE